jgi:hypothetical protein
MGTSTQQLNQQLILGQAKRNGSSIAPQSEQPQSLGPQVGQLGPDPSTRLGLRGRKTRRGCLSREKAVYSSAALCSHTCASLICRQSPNHGRPYRGSVTTATRSMTHRNRVLRVFRITAPGDLEHATWAYL